MALYGAHNFTVKATVDTSDYVTGGAIDENLTVIVNFLCAITSISEQTTIPTT